MQTQKQRIEDYLLRHKSIDTVVAVRMGILRLGSIIYRLRKQGWVIDSAPAKRRGQVKQYYRYDFLGIES